MFPQATSEGIAWKTFLMPFSQDLWLMLIFNSIMIAISLLAFHGDSLKDAHYGRIFWNFLGYIWIVFSGHFGHKPPEMDGKKRHSIRMTWFTVALTGNVIFMTYRASLTSELSDRTLHEPFTTLEEFLDSYFS